MSSIQVMPIYISAMELSEFHSILTITRRIVVKYARQKNNMSVF